MNGTQWRMWIMGISIVSAVASTTLWSIPKTLSAQEPRRFSYQVVDVPGDTHALQTVLNDFGGRGWELVAVAMGEIQVPRLIFKK